MVVSGARAAVEKAIDVARDKGVKRAVLLPVSARARAAWPAFEQEPLTVPFAW